MFCGKCGASNSDVAQFCASCGAQLTGGVQGSGAAPDKRKRNRTIGIVVTVVVLLAVAVGAFLLIRGGGKNDESYEKQLVGLWIDEDGYTLEFCADGTVLTVWTLDEEGAIKWSIVNGDTIELRVDGEYDTEQHKILSLQGDQLTMQNLSSGDTDHLFRSFEALQAYEYAGRN